MSPSAKFTRWVPWDERARLPGITEAAGVYLIGHFVKPPSGAADATSHEVVIIGESTGQSLWERLGGFDRCAYRLSAWEHSTAKVHRRKYKDSARDLINVAINTADDLNGVAEKAWIKYLERKLIWTYVKEWGELPACNRE